MSQADLADNRSTIIAEQAAAGEHVFSTERKQFALPLLAVLLVAGLLYATFALSWTKFSRAEVFFAECAREMIACNNWITPLYHHKPFFDKPILVYWLIVSMFKLFGVSHFVARVPSMLAGVTTVALTAFATRWMATKKQELAGLTAAMCLGSSFMFFSFVYLCMSDMFLVLFDTTTLMLFWAGLINDRKRTRYWLLAATSMGFAFVTKGPVGIVLPGAAMVAFLVLTKRLSYVKPLHVVAGGIIAALIAVPWFYAAYKANGSWALAYFFIRENFQRYAGSTYDTHKPIWFMTTSLLGGFLPWSVFLPGALAGAVSSWRRGLSEASSQRKMFLWIWVAVVTAFFSLSRGKCDYYVLPVYPAAAALVALYLVDAPTKAMKNVAIGVSALFVAGGLLSPFLLASVTGTTFSGWWIMPTVLSVFGIVALVAATRQRIVAWVAATFCAVCFAGAGFACQILPSVGRLQSLDVYAQAMRKTPANTHIGVHTALGHWVDELTFQVERDPVELTDSQSIESFFASGPAMALLPEQNYRQALADLPGMRAMPLHVVDQRRVANHPLTPGYVMKRKGNLYDTTLVLVSN